jgi:hypothetical protein
MSGKKLTPVQFYLDKVFDIIGDDVLDKLSNEQLNKIRNLGIQAKEMEKEQIAEAYWNGSDGIEDKTSILKIGIEYYNETYGGGEQ